MLLEKPRKSVNLWRVMFRLWPTLMLATAMMAVQPAWAQETENITMKPTEKLPLLDLLEAAVKDLQMPSETDAPFQVFFVPNSALSNPPTAASLNAEKATPETKPNSVAPQQWAMILHINAPFKETRELAAFFEDAATIEDWMEEGEQEVAKRFAALRDLIAKELGEPRVLIFGDAEMDVVIVGKVESGFLGVQTKIVET